MWKWQVDCRRFGTMWFPVCARRFSETPNAPEIHKLVAFDVYLGDWQFANGEAL